MTTVQSTTQSNFLRRVLQANGIFSGLSGVAFILAARPLAAFLGLAAPVILMGIGLGLLLYAVALFREAARETIDRQFVIAAIIMDAAWVVGSIVLLLTGWVPFTLAGKWAIALVADLVAIFAGLQFYGLRRLNRS
jgi:hypothetical protein